MRFDPIRTTCNDGPEDRIFFVVWLLVTLWLFACALLIQGEYADGYDTIVNSRYLFGDSPGYNYSRGPLFAVLLWPVEQFVDVMSLGVFDVRPYHFFTAILHSLYLIGIWILIRRQGISGYANLLAFLAAVLTIVFYAYAPYLSHDLISGLAFIFMIVIFDRWLSCPNIRLSIWLVLIGVLLTLIKQTYAIFWISLLVYAFLSLVFRWKGDSMSLVKLVYLGSMASVSGIMSWLLYCFFTSGGLPDAFFLLRPLVIMDGVSRSYMGDMSKIFPWDLYVNNIHNYGIVAMILVVPGLVFGLRGKNRFFRIVSVCWMLSFIIINIVSFREVRYLGFLAPLTACLILPVFNALIRNKLLLSLVLLVLIFDQYRAMSLAVEHLKFPSKLNVSRFLDFDQSGNSGRIFMSPRLSFVYYARSPFINDIYHGIYHFTYEMVSNLSQGDYGVNVFEDPGSLGMLDIQQGDKVYLSNGVISRSYPWLDDNSPVDLSQHIMVRGDVWFVTFVRRGDVFVLENGYAGYIMPIPSREVGLQFPVIISRYLAVDDAQRLYGDISQLKEISVLAIAITALCQADECQY